MTLTEIVGLAVIVAAAAVVAWWVRHNQGEPPHSRDDRKPVVKHS